VPYSEISYCEYNDKTSGLITVYNSLFTPFKASLNNGPTSNVFTTNSLPNITAESLIKKWTPRALTGIIQALTKKTKTLCRNAKFLKH
jgi:hypothetical protein